MKIPHILHSMKSPCALIFMVAAMTALCAIASAAPPAPQPRVLEDVQVKYPDHTVFYQRIEPPAPQPRATAAAVQKAKPATREEAAAAERREKKTTKVLMLSATVYDHRLTELCWRSGGREIRAWSNADFNLFTAHSEFETEDTIYTLFMALGNEDAESLVAAQARATSEGWNPPRVQSPTARPQAQYSLVSDTKTPSPETLAPLDALHHTYEENYTRLAKEHTQREAARAAQAQSLKDHPPVPQDTVIQFWPKKSHTYPTSSK